MELIYKCHRCGHFWVFVAKATDYKHQKCPRCGKLTSPEPILIPSPY